jgi:receptor protein-tyrosine kinase
LSIVEKALQKLQGSGATSPAPAAAAAAPAATKLNTPKRPPAAPAQRPTPRAVVETRVAATIHPDRDRMAEHGLIAIAEGSARRFRDEMRRIKWALAKLPPAINPLLQNLIMVTSAVPGEGKSFLSYNLGVALATESDRHVWIVDTDFVRRTLGRAFGVDEQKGLLDVIADPDLSIEDVLLATDIPGLFIVPSGLPRPGLDGPELIGSPRAAALLASIATTHPHVSVIFDTAPVLATSIPQALAPLVGQVLVAVKADATPTNTVQEAIAQLHRTEGVALVLNQYQRLLREDPYYYDGYYDSPPSRSER